MWQWQKAPELFAATAGEVVIMSIYMREDYTPIDKIIVTTDPNFVPSGFGPALTIESSPDLVYQLQNNDGKSVDLPMETPSRGRAGILEYEALQWVDRSDPNAVNRMFSIVDNSGTDPILNGELSHRAPIHEFDIDFIATGTHYLFVRHAAPDNANNPFTYYLDGVKIQEHHINTYSADGWSYYTDNPATFNVDAPGRHTLRIATREDGTPIDHFIITNNPNYLQPAGLPMPVKLVDFAARMMGAANLVEWTSSYESNTSHHLLERSTNGLNAWETVGQVAAAGNSEDYLDYTFADKRPYQRTYYRLTTVDFDGTSSSSSIVSVAREASATQLSVYPNPTTDHAVLTISHHEGGTALLRLSTLSGQLLADRSVAVTAGSNQVDIALDRFGPGTYILSLMLSGELQTQRIVVTR